MESQELFNILNTNMPHVRREFVDYLHIAGKRLELDESSTSEIAYGIAGMFATAFARGLAEDDPLVEIMTIAGELEINPKDADKLRRELIDKIQQV